MTQINAKKMELLAPAGSPEKMKYAFYYGADAVYAGVPSFSLRARINAFDLRSLKEGVDYAHDLGKKFYVTLNIYAHNSHLNKLERHLKKLSKIDVDGVILSDPGILEVVREQLPKVEIHLSTQANATNWRAVKFWSDQGIKRIVLAREVTLEEIKEIHKKVPEIELEYFVHGAMCMSYSGRCILSKWMSGKSANLGDCSQPCRWNYYQKSQALNKRDQIEPKLQKSNCQSISNCMRVTDSRGEVDLDLEEDNQGTYFFNSKDLNLISYLQSLIDAGVTSFKVEGRNKSVYYLANVIRAYRRVLDSAESKAVLREEQVNLDDLVHRGYTAGFLLGEEPEHNFKNSHNKSKYEFVGEILGLKDKKLAEVKVHNAVYRDDKVEVIAQNSNYPVKILEIYNEKMEKVGSAHGGHKGVYYFEFDKKDINPMSLLRRKIKNNTRTRAKIKVKPKTKADTNAKTKIN